jgi:hypothetical protein
VKQGAALLAVLVPIVAAAGFTGGCAVGAETYADEERASPLIYGADDRREYFELAAPDERALMSGAAVALLPRSALRRTETGIEIDAPTWSELANVCPDERFAGEPAAAFCSGVLVDWDLVLTAGHCLRLLALQDFAVVFGYLYDAPDHLALGPDDVANPVEIVHEALDPEGASPRLDYGWLRLDRPVRPPHHPAGVRLHPAPAPDDPLIAIGAGGGIPLKWDAGGRVGDARAGVGDYFFASTDTSGGSSGGGAFDASHALLGVTARGAPDLAASEAGCATIVHEPDGSEAAEQFTYAARAVEGLCGAHPEASTLCRTDCGEPCEALPPAPAAAGCDVAGERRSGGGGLVLAALAGAVIWARRSRNRGPSR